MIRLWCIILLFLGIMTSLSSGWSAKLPPGEWQTLKSDNFTVYYEKQDHANADQLLDWYQKYLPEYAELLHVSIPKNISIFIAPNNARFNYFTRGLPEWTGGVVYPTRRLVALLSPRMQAYPEQFKVTALHEGVHLLTEVEGKAPLPKWLAEGLAVSLSGETMLKKRIPLARAVVLGKTFTLDEIDDVLSLGPEDAKVAYLQSIDLVNYIVDRWGWNAIAYLVNGFRNNETADDLFLSFSGDDLLNFEIEWHQDLRHRFRWWKIIEWFDLDMMLWGSASILVIVVGAMKIYTRRKYLHAPDESEIDSGYRYYDAPYPKIYSLNEENYYSNSYNESEESVENDEEEDD